MPTTPTNVSDLDGLFKEVYGDKLSNLIPDNAVLVKKVKFDKKKKIGIKFNQPVRLTQENGVTYAAGGSGAFALNAPINMSTKNAEIPSVQMLLRSQMDYEAASKASAGKSKSSFYEATKLMVQSMLESMTHRLECSMLYGNSATGLGYTDTANTVLTTTTAQLDISDATWAPGIWAGSEGAAVDVYDQTGAALLTNNGTADAFITKVDIENKAITITCTDTGDIAAIKAANTNGSDLTVHWKGTYTGTTTDMQGIDKIITNAGSLFGISAATYNLWKGNTYAMGGAITIANLLKSTTSAVAKGGLKEEVDCYVSPKSFAVINSLLSGYRRYDSSYSFNKGSIGTSNIQIYAQSGMMNVIPHSMVKEGEGFILPTKYVCRLGSTDVTFDRFGDSGKFFRELSDNAGYEVRCYSDQAIFIEKPAVTTKLTGITS
jgi:hypothetical protein